MDRTPHDSLLNSLAAASAFLCAVVASSVELTDALTGGGGALAELSAAVVAATAFAYYLGSPP